MTTQLTPISIARFLHERDLFAFERRTLADLLGLDDSRLSYLLQRMEEAGLIIRLERGKYLLLGLAPEQTLSNPLFIAGHLASPAYVSFWSALHFHGLTEQVPQRVFVAVTRSKRPRLFNGVTYQFVCLPPHRFFGYQRESLGGLPVVVANEAKALLDSLSLPAYAGGMAEVARALRTALKEDRVETAQLVEYAHHMGSASLNARLGCLLNLLGRPVEGLEAPRGPLVLDPQRPRRGEYCPRWKVYLNIPLDELFAPGVA